jgi:hypothetical protein
MNGGQMRTEDDYEILEHRYRRLRIAAQAVVDGTRAAGAGRPLCAVEPYLIRRLRREVAETPQPLGWFTMSADS